MENILKGEQTNKQPNKQANKDMTKTQKSNSKTKSFHSIRIAGKNGSFGSFGQDNKDMRAQRAARFSSHLKEKSAPVHASMNSFDVLKAVCM